MRILLVQHQAHGRRLFHHILSGHGHEVIDCLGADHLASALETGTFQLVLTDRNVPGVQASDVVRQLRSSEATAAALIVPIISREHQHEIPALLNSGASDYLLLPAELDELQLRIRVLLGHAEKLAAAHRDRTPTLGGQGDLAVGPERALPAGEDGERAGTVEPRESQTFLTSDAVASVMFDQNGWMWLVSPAFAALLHMQPGAMIGRNIKTIVHESDLPVIPRLIARSKTGRLRQQPEHIRLLQQDGKWLRVRAIGREATPVDSGTQQFIIEVDADRPDTRNAGDGSGALPVTLDGRDEFLLVAEEALVNRNLEREPVALLFISLDNFRTLNQTHGYETGDTVIEESRRRLVDMLAPEDVFASLGAGDFAVMISASSDHARAAALATRMISGLRARPVTTTQGQALAISASIGIALSGEDTKTVATLLRQADMAATVAKRSGRGHYEIFDLEIEFRTTNRLQTEQELVRAVARNEFRAFYQPEVHLETGAIVGAEALVRWEHPANGLILPGQFIELAETSELIVPIGVQILETAVQQAAAWLKEFDLDQQFVIGVNFSMKQFQRPHIVHEVRAILRRAGLPPGALRIEITESSLIDNDPRILGVLEHLRSHGIHLAIDDFGTGYASLTQLQALPIDTVKIDRTFVSGSGTGSGRLSIARSVASLALDSGMDVVVEGIETLEQLKLILNSRCTRGQGFYFSRPITPETFEFWLKSGPRPFQGAIRAARGDLGIPASTSS